LCRLRDVQEYNLEVKGIEDLEALKDDMLSERLKKLFQNKITFFVDTRRPTSAEEVAKYADLHFERTKEAKRGSVLERQTWSVKDQPFSLSYLANPNM
jgi:hypothetical protein